MIDERKLLALYGLKYNPFIPGMPVEDLWRSGEMDAFFFRVETSVLDGGFAAVIGENGSGKSKILQMLAEHLGNIGDVVVGVMERPQSKLGDWYRELGELFGVDLSPVNRYGGFKALRTRWREHIESTLFRPVLLIDEAQVIPNESLTEMRLLSSAHFDSEALLATVLCGDNSLPERFRHRELTALGSRVRTRLHLGQRTSAELRLFLDHLLDVSGAPALMTNDLKETLIAHCGGNLRMLTGMCDELLTTAATQEQQRLDEQLYFDTFGKTVPVGSASSNRKRPRR